MIFDSRIFCVTSVDSLGCTFLDWSLHWLSGQTKIFSIKAMRWLPITQNPLHQAEVNNAHNHIKNHKPGWRENQTVVEILQKNCQENVTSLYPGPLHFSTICELLDIPINQLKEKIDQVLDYQLRDFVNMLRWVAVAKKIPVVFVAFDKSAHGYRWKPRSVDLMLTKKKIAGSVQNLRDEFNEVFFLGHTQDWDLTNVWDQREKMALDWRPFQSRPSDDLFLDHPHLHVNCQDLWFDTERTVLAIIDWLRLPLDHSRMPHWQSVAKHWQHMQNDQMKFPRLLPKILSAIINGHDYQLPTLTFDQEVIIQHCLIYQYNLNLKTWNLEKFPDNAKDLHKLLEPNIHKL